MPKPELWAVICDGHIVSGNVYESETIANIKRDQLNRDYPDHIREVVPFIRAPKPTISNSDASEEHF